MTSLELELKEQQDLIDNKIRLIRLAGELVNMKVVNDSVQNTYLELREEVLGIPQVGEDYDIEVCHIFLL
mgnify:CR=1 FL=1